MEVVTVYERIKDDELTNIIKGYISGIKKDLGKVLILPPDLTRAHSGAGRITEILYELLHEKCIVDVMPALGTHDPMTPDECSRMYGRAIPRERYIVHNWLTDVMNVGTVPGGFVRDVSEGLLDYPINVEVNRKIFDSTYDLIISVGQVVPHEVVGMANYSKNIFVGCGGRDIINKSHLLGAVYGMERMMGEDHSPVRKVLDYAENRFLAGIPLLYILTVTTARKDDVNIEGIFIGRGRDIFESAVKLSREKNITVLDKKLDKVVVFLDEKEFKSTWIGNKAIYRTRMAIRDGGVLLIIAPGVKKFGEDDKIDRLIRKYGYVGKDEILRLYRGNEDLREDPSAAAHLIHGSSDGRFDIIYAVKHLTREQVESVNFSYMDYNDAVRRYDPDLLDEGYNTLADGEKLYFIRNPALGLWKSV